MLVIHIEADFLKKAADTLTFTCINGTAFQSAIEMALDTGEAQSFQAESIATLPDGREAAKVRITWSFKRKLVG